VLFDLSTVRLRYSTGSIARCAICVDVSLFSSFFIFLFFSVKLSTISFCKFYVTNTTLFLAKWLFSTVSPWL
jgi:hypothetical protein